MITQTDNYTVIYISYEKAKADLLMNTLTYNGIATKRQPIGQGVMPSIFKSGPAKGEEISVPGDQREQALVLLEALNLHKGKEADSPAEYNKSTIWLARFAIILIIAIVIGGLCL